MAILLWRFKLAVLDKKSAELPIRGHVMLSQGDTYRTPTISGRHRVWIEESKDIKTLRTSTVFLFDASLRKKIHQVHRVCEHEKNFLR